MADTLLLLAAAGYALAALAYLALAGLIVASWRTRPHGRILAAAAALTALWGSALVFGETLHLSSGSLIALEAARNGPGWRCSSISSSFACRKRAARRCPCPCVRCAHSDCCWWQA